MSKSKAKPKDERKEPEGPKMDGLTVLQLIVALRRFRGDLPVLTDGWLADEPAWNVSAHDYKGKAYVLIGRRHEE